MSSFNQKQKLNAVQMGKLRSWETV